MERIKKAVLEFKNVYWMSMDYRVKYDSVCREFIIECVPNGHIVGLHEGSYSEWEFFIRD